MYGAAVDDHFHGVGTGGPDFTLETLLIFIHGVQIAVYLHMPCARGACKLHR